MVALFVVKKLENTLITEEEVVQVAVPFSAVPCKVVHMNVSSANPTKVSAKSIQNHGKAANTADFKSVSKVG